MNRYIYEAGHTTQLIVPFESKCSPYDAHPLISIEALQYQITADLCSKSDFWYFRGRGREREGDNREYDKSTNPQMFIKSISNCKSNGLSIQKTHINHFRFQVFYASKRIRNFDNFC